MVKLGVASIGGSPPMHISSEDVDDSVLNFFGNGYQIHVITTSRWAFHLSIRDPASALRPRGIECAYLNIVAIVLIEPLKTFYKQEVRGEPCEKWLSTMPT